MGEVFQMNVPDVLSGQIETTGRGGFPRFVISGSLAPCIVHSAITGRLAELG